MTFHECVLECAANRELVAEYDRLTGSRLGQLPNRSPIEQMVDEASGRNNTEAAKFAVFVHEFVWTRLATTPSAG